MARLLAVIFLVCVVAVSAVIADIVKVFETTIGETYDFVERDLLEMIYAHIENNKEDIEKRFKDHQENAKERIKNYEPKKVIYLPRATENKIFSPDMTYIVPDDVIDAEGKIIYPKGYSFNPLDYNRLPISYIVIDYADKLQAEFIKTSDYIGKLNYQIVTTSGKYSEIVKELNQSVFYADFTFADRFQLEKTPSLISQMGNRIIVKEICIDCEKNTTKDKK
jgi:conjugal transfer pilus assembly protein TraW